MNYRLSDLVDAKLFREMLESFNQIIPFSLEITENDVSTTTSSSIDRIIRQNPSSEEITEYVIPIVAEGRHLGDFVATRIAETNSDSNHLKNQFEKYDALMSSIVSLIAGEASKNLKARQCRQKLEESEEKYRSLIDNLPDIVARFDRKLRYLYVNKRVEKVNGIPADKFIGKTNEELGFPDETISIWNNNLRKVLSEGKDYRSEFTYKNGSRARHFADLLVPEFNDQGEVVSVLSVIRDVTEAKNSKKNLVLQRDINLMLSESRNLSEALNQLLDYIFQLEGIDCGGIYLVDQNTGDICLEVHRGVSEDFIQAVSHYKSDTPNAVMLNSGTTNFVKISDFKLLNKAEIINEGLKFIAIFPVCFEGKPIASLNLSSHTHDEISAADQIFLETIASNLGGTIQRINALNKLSESETKYKKVFQTSPDSVTISTIEGIYVDVNNGFTSIVGYSREEVIGKNSADIKIWAIPEDRAKIVGLLLNNLRFENFETIFRTKNGKLVTALVSANLFTLNDKPHILLISRDISDRKVAENQLRIALEKAEESNRLKSMFLANLSHELRTPMNGILGFADLLVDDGLSRELKQEYINIINDSGQSLLEVITNLMDISKLDSCQIEFKYRAFNLNELMAEMLRWLKSERLIRDKPSLHIELLTPLPADQAIIYSDPGKIRHILSLLLNNAAKFTSNGFVRFGYSMEKQNVRFFVQDSGKGISPEKQSVIFERFRQEDETLSRKYGGIGLGLTIARSLTELIGGKIGVDSEPGKGSKFWFEIPVGPKKENVAFHLPPSLP